MNRVVALLLLACPALAHADTDAFALVGRVGVLQRLHRTLDRYQRMRVDLPDDGKLRVDALTLGLFHSHGGVKPRQRLLLNQTGHVLAVDRLVGDFGLALFRSSANDSVFQEDEAGEITDRVGLKITVMGGQVWYRDWLAVAVGWIGQPGPLGDRDLPAAPVDRPEQASPLFLRLDAPRLGAWGRVDLLGAEGIGDAALGFDSGPLLDPFALEIDARRFHADGAWWARSRGVWKPHRVVGATALLGADLGRGEVNQAGLGMRMGHRVGTMIDLEGTFEFGGARVYRDALDPTPAWAPAMGVDMHVWLNHKHMSLGAEVGAGLNWPHAQSLTPVFEGSNAVYLGGHVRIGI